MKKLVTILLSAILLLYVVSCGNDNKSGGESKNEYADVGAIEVLNKVWGSYKDEEKFPIIGGDTSEDNITTDAPGKFDIGDSAALDTTLGFPAADIDKIDQAASVIHMMNANTFTCGAFHVKDAGDVDAICTSIKDNIMQRQWICGFPEKLVIATVGNNVVSSFGETEIIDGFKEKLTAAYESSEIVCDAPIE